MNLLRKSKDITVPTEELLHSPRSRRDFLTRSAASAAGVVGGAAVLNAVMASPAAAAVGDTTLIAPVRVFDSRPGKTFSGEGQNAGTIFTYTGTPTKRGVIFGLSGSNTDLILSTAQGAIINLTITNTAATGALGVTGGSDNAAPAASLINWFGSGQILANSAIVPVDPQNTGKSNSSVAGMNVWIVAGTAGVSQTHYIVDCFGYVE